VPVYGELSQTVGPNGPWTVTASEPVEAVYLPKNFAAAQEAKERYGDRVRVVVGHFSIPDGVQRKPNNCKPLGKSKRSSLSVSVTPTTIPYGDEITVKAVIKSRTSRIFAFDQARIVLVNASGDILSADIGSTAQTGPDTFRRPRKSFSYKLPMSTASCVAGADSQAVRAGRHRAVLEYVERGRVYRTRSFPVVVGEP
jgi:hypothetical protein